MSEAINVPAEPREDFGKNASRRLRRGGRVPAILYGDRGPAIPIAVEPRAIQSVLGSGAGHNAIFSLEIKGKAPARVMLREWQVDPVLGHLLHVDMVRVSRGAKLRLKVPVHVTGEPKGVKVQGGVFEFVLREVEIECLPDDIPEHVTMDVTELMIGKNLRVSDLPLGPNVKVLTDSERVVAHVVTLKAEEEKPAAEAVEAAPAEPEVIKKGKVVTEEEAAAEEGAEAKPEAKKESRKEGRKES
ncbi:MAG: 50S ribosomal protein L25 [Acidobacteria bacterium]|nr:MAG: 50S ribosomal protein L25 [Acidobacteriota bacterium]